MYIHVILLSLNLVYQGAMEYRDSWNANAGASDYIASQVPSDHVGLKICCLGSILD